MMAFYHVIHIRDVNTFVVTAVQLGQIFIDLKNHNVRLAQNLTGYAGGGGQIKVPVPIHRRHTRHGDIDRQKVLVIIRI